MSGRRPLSAQTLRQVAGSVVVIIGVIAFIVLLRQTAPQIDLAPPIPGLANVASDLGEVVPCGVDVPGPEENVTGRAVARVTSTTATQCPRQWDGLTVGYVGEVVGHVLRRDGGGWVQMNDDGFALESGPLPNHLEFHGVNSGLFVWLPDDLLDHVTHPGESRWQGDVLAVTATFVRTDLDEGGQLTLRATDAVTLAAARPIPRPLHWNLIAAAVAAAAVAVWLVRRERRLREQR